MKGLPSGYNKDLQEDKEAVFDTEDTVAGSLLSCEAVVRTLRVRRDVTQRAAGGLMLATDVADYLVRKGLPFRDAHELVGGMVRTLLEERQGHRVTDLLTSGGDSRRCSTTMWWRPSRPWRPSGRDRRRRAPRRPPWRHGWREMQELDSSESRMMC